MRTKSFLFNFFKFRWTNLFIILIILSSFQLFSFLWGKYSTIKSLGPPYAFKFSTDLKYVSNSNVSSKLNSKTVLDSREREEDGESTSYDSMQKEGKVEVNRGDKEERRNIADGDEKERKKDKENVRRMVNANMNEIGNKNENENKETVLKIINHQIEEKEKVNENEKEDKEDLNLVKTSKILKMEEEESKMIKERKKKEDEKEKVKKKKVFEVKKDDDDDKIKKNDEDNSKEEDEMENSESRDLTGSVTKKSKSTSRSTPKTESNSISKSNIVLHPQCKYHEGKWMKINNQKQSKSKPKDRESESEKDSENLTQGKNIIYDGKNCSFLSINWNCLHHHRPNYDYLNYKWKPFDCDLPDFDPVDFLKKMKNKVFAFIGDSIGQQHYQSLLCLLSTSSLGSVWEDVGTSFGFFIPEGSLRPTGWAYRFTKTNTTIAFAWNSVLCMQEKYFDAELALPRVAMHLDRPDPFVVDKFDQLDVLVLNTGSHWNRGKMKLNGWLFFLNGEKVKPKGKKQMTMGTAINITVSSTSAFLHRKIEEAKERREKQGGRGRVPLIFFRTLSARHFMNGEWNTGGGCDDVQHVLDEKEIEGRPQRDNVVENAVHNTNVILLNITHLTQYRGDSHPAGYVRKGTQDCLHWCLPGVPDVWNQIIYSHILFNQGNMDESAT